MPIFSVNFWIFTHLLGPYRPCFVCHFSVAAAATRWVKPSNGSHANITPPSNSHLKNIQPFSSSFHFFFHNNGSHVKFSTTITRCTTIHPYSAAIPILFKPYFSSISIVKHTPHHTSLPHMSSFPSHRRTAAGAAAARAVAGSEAAATACCAASACR
jgi:hypothetical protein